MISLTNHDSSEGEQWGRYNLPRSVYMYNIPLHHYQIMYVSGSEIICDIEIDLSNSALGNPQAAWTRYTDLEFWPIPQKDQKQAWITLKTVCRAALSLFPTSFFDFVFLGQTLHTAASVFGFPGSALKMVLA